MHIYPGAVNTPLVKLNHWALRPLNLLTSVFATSPQDSAEWMLHGLFQTDQGFSRRDTHGDDIGKTSHYGSEKEREAVWEHTKEEIECALNKDISSA